MYKKANSFYERQRKLISRFFAGLLIVLALAKTPVASSSLVYEYMEWLGFALLILAALGRVWCSIYISGRKNRVLCMEGPYSLCRNPLYLFSFIGVLGFFIALKSLILCGIAAGLFLFYYRGVIFSEEKRLGHLFGAPFDRYQETTPRFFPAFRAATRVEELSIAPRIIERGLSEVVWFLFAIIGVEMIEMIHSLGYLNFIEFPF